MFGYFYSSYLCLNHTKVFQILLEVIVNLQLHLAVTLHRALLWALNPARRADHALLYASYDQILNLKRNHLLYLWYQWRDGPPG